MMRPVSELIELPPVGCGPMRDQRRLQLVTWAPLVTVLGGVAVMGASETAGNILILIGALCQMGVAYGMWTGVYGARSAMGSARVWAGVLFAVAVILAVSSIGRLV